MRLDRQVKVANVIGGWGRGTEIKVLELFLAVELSKSVIYL